MIEDSDLRLDKVVLDEDFSFVKHNPSDFETFRKFQETQNSRFEKFEEEKSRLARIANLKKWDEGLPVRWKDARLKSITRPGAKEAANQIISMMKSDKENLLSFFLEGGPGVGKTYLAYAIVRGYLGLGLVSPSQIRIISEEGLLSMAAAGFEGRSRFEELLNGNFKLFLFDSVGAKTTYNEKEKGMWEQIIDHIYTKSLSAVFTSSSTSQFFSDQLSPSGESKFGHLVSGRILEIKSEDSEKNNVFQEKATLEKNIADRDENLFSTFQ